MWIDERHLSCYEKATEWKTSTEFPGKLHDRLMFL